MARKTHKSQQAARTAILDAAEKVITGVGPAGLRISAVAKEAGMAHPNVLHHFGSREGLIAAVAERVGLRATERITAAIKTAAEASADKKHLALTAVLDTAFLGDEGRLVAWLHMSGVENSMDANMQRILAMAQELRRTVDANADPINTNRLVVLITLALVGEVVYGSGITDALGFNDSENKDHNSFRAWLASIVMGLSDDVLNAMTVVPSQSKSDDD
ncbi:MAG: TetR/AcrR family transcriptional regulator [Gammaproteobacteria bacterium]|nr:TetR/AcrR family transcriptional regulator [Gammaproteobacteria bacterium]MBT8150373.1 TetR/AcrR family transcriptional regulator [Gammaproteobacteria bacterium]NND40171.1 TetR/AcrR family transcriptional regulator [Pseudomonadales bacterium]NNM11421.1 TetR/AcrR family transcriptional regulator [Pseudomonadales bacterium]RZV54207.1 MAG: TetR/AcrR family transcriptional regulator [Pseudomonadales bacterium]